MYEGVNPTKNNTNELYKKLLSKFAILYRKSCVEVIYEPIISENKVSRHLAHLSYYFEYNYNPKLKFLRYSVNFFGLLGLWYGISIQDLHKIFEISNKCFNNVKLMNMFIHVY